MEKTPIIRVKNLYKIYRVGETKVRALNGVEFTLYKGEFCAIVGTSGSGKSGSPADLVFFALLVSFAWALKGQQRLVQKV